jgi:ABC-type Fe3+-hydroxamate transport system substrate-binding protein
MLVKDQLGNVLEFKQTPKRIISLVPSQSELLWDLGLREEIIGVTKFCIHPKNLFNISKRIGGTKSLNIDLIRELKPDLIIGNKEENEKSQIELLQKEFPVWLSDIYTLADALEMITLLGEVLNKKAQAKIITKFIAEAFTELGKINKTVLYLIWNNPYMAAGQANFIGNMLLAMGLQNVIEDKQSRYPTLDITHIKELNPEIIFLSTEPFPFNNTHVDELKKYLPNSNILLVDGELFSWYGSRLLKSVDYFNELIEESL